eukprot:superscaffoldBa00004087_g18241
MYLYLRFDFWKQYHQIICYSPIWLQRTLEHGRDECRRQVSTCLSSGVVSRSCLSCWRAQPMSSCPREPACYAPVFFNVSHRRFRWLEALRVQRALVSLILQPQGVSQMDLRDSSSAWMLGLDIFSHMAEAEEFGKERRELWLESWHYPGREPYVFETLHRFLVDPV